MNASQILFRRTLGHAIGCAVLAMSIVQLPEVRANDKPLPAHVDLLPEFEKLNLPARWQSDRDVCSTFAITALANFELAKTEPATHAKLSEEFLIWAGKKSTGKPGEQAMFYEAIHGLNQLGVCSDQLMAFVATSDANRVPSAKAIADARLLRERWKVEWIRRWDVKSPMTDLQFHAIKQALVDHHPVASGLRWPKKLGDYKLLKVLPPQDVEDGHSIVFMGYTDDPKEPSGGRFHFRNSWGEDWGQHGYGEMSYGYARAYANDALWMHFGTKDSELPLWRFEGESQQIRHHENCEANRQSMKDFRAPLWSHGQHLLCQAQQGGFVELNLEVGRAGKYRLRVMGTAGPDFGIVRIAWNGNQSVHDFDLYSGRVCPSGSLEMGVLELNPGIHTLRCTAIGKNSASEGYFFGVDAIDLLPAP